MNTKTKNTTAWVFSILVSLVISFSGVSKIVGMEAIKVHLTQMGVGEYLVPLGIANVLFVALFLYPKTMKVGFLLLTCYWSGAIATSFSHGATDVGVVVLLTVLWVAAYLRAPEIFVKPSET